MATARTPLGFEVTASQKNAVAGGQAVMSIRPEKIGLQDQAAGTIMTGTVAGRSYLGGHTYYTVRVGEADLRVSMPNGTSQGPTLEVNDTVRIGFQPANARIFGK